MVCVCVCVCISGTDSKARKEFHGGINMLSIEKVTARDDVAFSLLARDAGDNNKRRQYKFKCENKETRDKWVAGLNDYVAYYHAMQSLLYV